MEEKPREIKAGRKLRAAFPMLREGAGAGGQQQ
jgi:hypothetical protein